MSRSLIPRREDFLFPMQQAFDQFFTDFFKDDRLPSIKASAGYPKMDVVESDGKFTINVAVSGMSSKDVDIEVTPENVLTIRGRISEEYRAPDSDTRFYLRELRASAFERQVRLPDHIVGDPSATLKDGMLTLTWDLSPKEQPPPVKKIAITEK